MKTCGGCKETKSITDFYKMKRSKDSYHSQCKDCAKAYNQRWSKTDNGKSSLVKAALKYKRTEKGKESAKRWTHKIQGVYGIFENGICLYVGESKRLLHRLADHKSFIKNPECIESKRNPLYSRLTKHNHLIFGVLEETPNHKERETYYINQLKPLYNA